jgi:predicted MFS family arabinose efflux permease
MNNDSKMSKWGLLSLALSRGVTNLPIVVLGMVLIEIAATFNISVGMAGQLTTAFSVVAIIFSLLMGIISTKFDHRNLLCLGLILYLITATLTYFVDSFVLLLTVFALSGIATAIVISMPNALIGELLPVNKRTSAIGLTLVITALMFLIGAQATDVISGNMGWRSAIFWVINPLTILTVILVYLKIPQTASQHTTRGPTVDILSGFREVAKSTSAIACLIGTMLGLATFNVFLVYGVSLWRQVYGVTMSFVSVVMVVLPIFYIVGCLVTDSLTNKLGRKALTSASAATAALFTLAATNAPEIWSSVILSLFASFLGGIMFTVSTSLTLEQVPENMGTMMSVHSAAINMGATIASILGGIVIVSYSYSIYGLVMGVIGLVGALIFYIYSNDPTHPLGGS